MGRSRGAYGSTGRVRPGRGHRTIRAGTGTERPKGDAARPVPRRPLPVLAGPQSPYSDIASISRADEGGTVTPLIRDGFTGTGALFTGALQCGAIRAQSPRSAARLNSDSGNAVCFDISAP
ncbi:hypothetical protein P376_5966 [Streptomyces sp. HCCB10043]|nr:hypothetical protein P376_5966 [Streptomyces sp. HCCB10043]